MDPESDRVMETGNRGGDGEADDADYDTVDFEDEKDPYDIIATAGDIRNMQREIERDIASRALEMELRSETELTEFVDLAELDLGSLDRLLPEKTQAGNPDEEDAALSDWKKGELEVIKDGIRSALDRCGREGEKLKIASAKTDRTIRFMEFLEEHKRAISLLQLFDLMAAGGGALLTNTANADVKVEVNDRIITLGDMMENPEIIAAMNGLSEAGENQTFGPSYYSETDVFEDKARKFYFNVSREDTGDRSFEKRISLCPSHFIPAEWQNLTDDLNRSGLPLCQEEGIPFEVFVKNKELIVKKISDNLSVNETLLAKNIDGFIGYDVPGVYVVEFEDFEVDGERRPSENFSLLKDYESGAARSSENYTFAQQEAFRVLFLEKLKEAGYDEEKLNQESPENVLRIITEVLSRNIDYDDDHEVFTKFSWVQPNAGNDSSIHAGAAPRVALETGKANCWAWTMTFLNAKLVTEEAGVTGLGNVACFPVQLVGAEHSIIGIATENAEGEIICTFIDLTTDDPEKSNAVDDSYTSTYFVKQSKIYLALRVKADMILRQKNIMEPINPDQYAGSGQKILIDPKVAAEMKRARETMEVRAKNEEAVRRIMAMMQEMEKKDSHRK